MDDLKSLIPVSYDNPERPTVSGRELHDFLEVTTRYNDWFNRMTEYGFTEGEDYYSFLSNRSDGLAGKPRTDHQLTIPMAKELCMIQRNERGKQARQYFLAIEAQWNSPEAVMRRAVLIAQKQNDQLKAVNKQLLAENNDLKPDAEYARAVCVCKNCRTTTTLAKDYGLSAEKLNSILHGLKIQYKTSDGQWVLYAKYCGKGYTKNRKSTPFQHKSTGEWDTKNTTVWTEAGQRFIYEQLKAVGMLPSVEHRQSVEQMYSTQQRHDKAIEQLTESMDTMKEVMTTDVNGDWRTACGHAIQAVARKLGGGKAYEEAWNEVYTEMERNGFFVRRRLENRKKSAAAQGMSPTYVRKLNALDIIADSKDKKLMSAFINATNKLAAAHSVRMDRLNELPAVEEQPEQAAFDRTCAPAGKLIDTRDAAIRG